MNNKKSIFEIQIVMFLLCLYKIFLLLNAKIAVMTYCDCKKMEVKLILWYV